ncbi:lactonase family protein [Sediminibacillus albus]|uniref:6-phosphogluconolactonase n=1 Tax=Sediminibacillus albus TaxID=407036 RepID=A0A1G8WVM8_9BACI|nr:lactonase family protein [Sediminibacillus albus]SDJ82462.1 6-phosphogluconolactonase [Sediminibacillus albus]
MAEKQSAIGYIGTYTNGESKGIYSFQLDRVHQKLTILDAAAHAGKPTYLTISDNNRYLYSVVQEDGNGGAAAYSIGSNGALAPINKQLLEGAAPCHISVDSSNQQLVTANYHKGTVESYLIEKDSGAIQPAVSVVEQNGSGPHERQEKPHVHFSGFTPDEKYVIVVDLGSDTVKTYQSNNGKLVEASCFNTKPGAGPRHIVFHPNGKFAYVMTELSSEVIVLAYNQQNGSFHEIQTIATIPADFTENNQGSAIHISADGRFIYAGNRGHNSIALFAVDEPEGKLSFVERYSTEGDWPRDFCLDPTENYMVASNQNSSSLTLFSRNLDTGKLELLQKDVEVPNPVCVKFLQD